MEQATAAENTGTALWDLPRYRSHKTLRAAKILSVTVGDPTMIYVEGFEPPFYFTPEEMKHKPEPKPGMYLVQYEKDGYISFSPGDAFEEGNRPVEAAPLQQHERIKGYRTLSDEEIATMNIIKEHGITLGDLVKLIEVTPNTDPRWISIGKTHLQQGLMALTRAVAKPDFL